MSFQFSKWTVLPAAVLLLGTVAAAQDTNTPSTPTQGTTTSAPASKPTIAQRKENQQDRIANGVQSGQLTAGETSKLETKEAAINGETRADRAANGGKLTTAEKQQINGQQNQLSKQIYNDKHNANTAQYGNNKVGQRRENQQDRIAQGIKSGQLTAGETAKLENQQKGINQQVKADRAANGGKLTSGEKTQINKEQNAASKNIYNKKHNANTQHPKK
jgi:predicted transglutaminase-like cysteine proteinase